MLAELLQQERRTRAPVDKNAMAVRRLHKRRVSIPDIEKLHPNFRLALAERRDCKPGVNDGKHANQRPSQRFLANEPPWYKGGQRTHRALGRGCLRTLLQPPV